ncbi:DUF6489 family protein [Paraurantiacibacter namhicola]|uniref:Uncharacterized protein n=1 Tax=Paraurantiacibacter namhicola TaxID=645517 RepID=A0A1C7D5M0_9SPHN|nr:DUF6489 family protein [Paraurantiacibacter namhicola]ANU06748.1 hypothetical protein A6F65_00423 [Paraurantiacibacter namhicola]
MKMHIEIDCTPEEARQFMGLPDVEKANSVYIDTITNAMKGTSNTEQLETYAKQLAPMGQLGLKMFQNFMENASSAAQAGSKGASSPSSSKKK